MCSEFELIRFLRTLSPQIGDDCAVIDPSFAHRLVLSTDLLVDGVHFRNDWISPRMLGRKACRVNLSDLAAMGARPHACLLSLALPPDYPEACFRDLVSGFVSDAESVGLRLVGGDLSRSERLVVSVALWGFVGAGEPIPRAGARPGDHLLLVGRVGYSRRGLQFLEDSAQGLFVEASDEQEIREKAGEGPQYEWLISHLLPEILVEPAVWLQRHGLASSMIDVSDGLSADIMHILEESQVGGEIDLECIPPVPGVNDMVQFRRLVLSGGEDYALVFTASREQLETIEQEYPNDWPRPLRIGKIMEGPPRLSIREAGTFQFIEPEGFNHFR